MSGLSLWTIEDSLATLLGAREELLAESQHPTPTRESAEISAEIAEVEKALAEYLAREVAKVDGIHSYLRWADSNASAARVEAQQMAERARRLEGGAKRLRQLCCDIMAQRGLKRLEGTGGRVLLRRGNGRSIVNIASIAGLRNMDSPLDAYKVSKAAATGINIAGATSDCRRIISARSGFRAGLVAAAAAAAAAAARRRRKSRRK